MSRWTREAAGRDSDDGGYPEYLAVTEPELDRLERELAEYNARPAKWAAETAYLKRALAAQEAEYNRCGAAWMLDRWVALAETLETRPLEDPRPCNVAGHAERIAVLRTEKLAAFRLHCQELGLDGEGE